MIARMTRCQGFRNQEQDAIQVRVTHRIKELRPPLKRYAHPTGWTPPPPKAILGIGESKFRYWNDVAHLVCEEPDMTNGDEGNSAAANVGKTTVVTTAGGLGANGSPTTMGKLGNSVNRF